MAAPSHADINVVKVATEKTFLLIESLTRP